jgi:hypothetical protein
MDCAFFSAANKAAFSCFKCASEFIACALSVGQAVEIPEGFCMLFVVGINTDVTPAPIAIPTVKLINIFNTVPPFKNANSARAEFALI